MEREAECCCGVAAADSHHTDGLSADRGQEPASLAHEFGVALPHLLARFAGRHLHGAGERRLVLAPALARDDVQELMDVDRRQHLVAAIAGVRPHIVVVDALLVRQLVLRKESAKLGPQGLDLLSLLRL